MITLTEAATKIRMARTKDIEAILQLESIHGEGLWNKEMLIMAMTQDQSVEVLVAIDGKDIIGLLIYEVCKHKYDVITLVCKDRDFCIGKLLLDNIISKLAVMNKNRIIVSVRESDLATQLFLRDMKFLCVKIDRKWYQDYISEGVISTEDAYQFKYENTSTSGKMVEGTKV